MAERRDSKVSTKDKIFISFDLGIRDATAMTFGKFTEDNKLIVFHHYKNNNQPTKHYIDYIKDEILKYTEIKNLNPEEIYEKLLKLNITDLLNKYNSLLIVSGFAP